VRVNALAEGVDAKFPEVEVSAKATRQRRSAAEKLRILKLADACTKVGELGAMLRKEGIYSSSLYAWRTAREKGELGALAPKKRGPKPVVPDARDRRIAELEKAAAKAELRAKRAEGLVELQKKVSELLGIQLPSQDENP
jgi:transposase-like protein